MAKEEKIFHLALLSNLPPDDIARDVGLDQMGRPQVGHPAQQSGLFFSVFLNCIYLFFIFSNYLMPPCTSDKTDKKMHSAQQSGLFFICFNCL